MKKTYNIVNSIKGGCGKTTLSIWLAAYLDYLTRDVSCRNAKVCLFDMDLQGSCMVSLFDGAGSKFEDYHYLQDLIRGYRIEGYTFIQNVKLKDRFIFSVIFASPRQSDKAAFYSGASSNYSPVMEYGTFRLGLKRFIEENDEMKRRRFEHLVFDMPPNADGYSDAALECVLNPKYTVVKRQDRVNLFMMMTLDISHIMATISGIEEIFSKANNKIPDRLFIVFNTNIVTKMSSKDQENLYCARKQNLETAIEKMNIDEKTKGTIYFLIMNSNVDYADICAKGHGLNNCESDRINMFETCPFSKYAEYGRTSFLDMDVNHFKNIFLN